MRPERPGCDQGPESGVFGLRAGPEAVEEFRGRAARRLAEAIELLLDMAVSPGEAFVRLPQSGLRFHLEVAGQVHDGKQEVAELGLACRRVGRIPGGVELRQLLVDLGARTGRIGPVESSLRRPRTELARAGQCG